MTDFVGIDVSAQHLVVASDREEFTVDNTREGSAELIKRLTRGHRRPVRVVMEHTGTYSLDPALDLHHATRLEVMVVNPRVARDFAGAMMRRSKTDPVDARILREFCRRMDFTPWQAPPAEVLELRTIARRGIALTEERTREKNRLHAVNRSKALACIRADILVSIKQLSERIEQLNKAALQLVDKHPRMLLAVQRLNAIKGFGFTSAIRIFAELSVLPKDMTTAQWVAHVGLDPRHIQSGKRAGKVRISKCGNRYIRAALYFPALSAACHDPNVSAYYQKLLAKGKKKMVAVVAVMRKLLHAIWGMFKHDTDFDGQKFHPLPA
ncbi:MAG: IS110 family RNA-guided transposase [Planctomycetota bacterium]|jgi:transposase